MRKWHSAQFLQQLLLYIVSYFWVVNLWLVCISWQWRSQWNCLKQQIPKLMAFATVRKYNDDCPKSIKINKGKYFHNIYSPKFYASLVSVRFLLVASFPDWWRHARRPIALPSLFRSRAEASQTVEIHFLGGLQKEILAICSFVDQFNSD